MLGSGIDPFNTTGIFTREVQQRAALTQTAAEVKLTAIHTFSDARRDQNSELARTLIYQRSRFRTLLLLYGLTTTLWAHFFFLSLNYFLVEQHNHFTFLPPSRHTQYLPTPWTPLFCVAVETLLRTLLQPGWMTFTSQ